MWQFLYAESKDRLELLPVDDGELWQLTVVDTVTTDMMGPARVDICRRAGRVCIWYVDRPVASEDRYDWMQRVTVFIILRSYDRVADRNMFIIVVIFIIVISNDQ